MAVSETAFLLKLTDGYNLRWFTPAVEVDLCGHATLASAHRMKPVER
jgi:PhzF family phenazine biosynthesis protein